MDFMNLPLDPAGFLDIRVAGFVAIIASQWLKKYLPDWRFTSLLALGVTVIVQIITVALAGSGAWFQGAWAGVLGASLATFGYEALMNLAGVAGVGPRSEEAIIAKAQELAEEIAKKAK